jgi:hypothetical protein
LLDSACPRAWLTGRLTKHGIFTTMQELYLEIRDPQTGEESDSVRVEPLGQGRYKLLETPIQTPGLRLHAVVSALVGSAGEPVWDHQGLFEPPQWVAWRLLYRTDQLPAIQELQAFVAGVQGQWEEFVGGVAYAHILPEHGTHFEQLMAQLQVTHLRMTP